MEMIDRWMDCIDWQFSKSSMLNTIVIGNVQSNFKMDNISNIKIYSYKQNLVLWLSILLI